MAKYSVPDDAWEDDEPEGPPAWKEDTSAVSIEIDVQLHDQGYQTDKKWTVHCTQKVHDDRLLAGYAIEHRNKGNYWRDGDRWKDAVDFADLPLRVRKRVAQVLNRDLGEITPDTRTIHREDGTGLGDENRKQRLEEMAEQSADTGTEPANSGEQSDETVDRSESC